MLPSESFYTIFDDVSVVKERLSPRSQEWNAGHCCAWSKPAKSLCDSGFATNQFGFDQGRFWFVAIKEAHKLGDQNAPAWWMSWRIVVSFGVKYAAVGMSL